MLKDANPNTNPPQHVFVPLPPAPPTPEEVADQCADICGGG